MKKFDNDSRTGHPLKDYQNIVESLGFEKVYEETYDIKTEYHDTKNDKLFIYAHRQYGILLVFDTWPNGTNVSSSKFYFTYQYKTKNHRLMGNSRWTRTGEYFYQSVDGRDSIKAKFDTLLKEGNFVNPWIPGQYFIDLINGSEKHIPNYDYRQITKDKIDKLPDWVKSFMSYDESEIL